MRHRPRGHDPQTQPLDSEFLPCCYPNACSKKPADCRRLIPMGSQSVGSSCGQTCITETAMPLEDERPHQKPRREPSLRRVCEAVGRRRSIPCDHSPSRIGLPRSFIATAEHTTLPDRRLIPMCSQSVGSSCGHATGRLTTGNHTLHGFDRFGSSYALFLTKRTLAHFRSLRSAAGSSRIDSSQAEGLYISQVMD